MIDRHQERVLAAVASDEAARSALVASWRRSMELHRLNPAERKLPKGLTEIELRDARERMEPMIAMAEASLDRLYLAVGGAGCCVLLADRNGVPVERRGAVTDDQSFREWGLWPGHVWSEESEGTNGIGTCLVERRPVTVHRDQHFYARNTAFSCTAAPIFDHHGQLAGAIDVSSCRADLTDGFVGLIVLAVADAVRRIEAEDLRRAFPKARLMVAPGVAYNPGGLIAVDRDDLVLGATCSARLALGLTPERLSRGLAVSDLMEPDLEPAEDLSLAERAVLQRVLLRTGGNVSEAARLLGISRATLHRKLNRAGLQRAR